MEIPKKRVITNVTIISNRFKFVDTSKHEYFGKLRYRHICGTIRFYQEYVSPVEAMAVFNNGKEEKGLASRIGMPEIIPRKIHQIWVKG